MLFCSPPFEANNCTASVVLGIEESKTSSTEGGRCKTQTTFTTTTVLISLNSEIVVAEGTGTESQATIEDCEQGDSDDA